MKYVLLFCGTADDAAAFVALSPEELRARYAEVGAWFAEHRSRIGATNQLQGPETATAVRFGPGPPTGAPSPPTSTATTSTTPPAPNCSATSAAATRPGPAGLRPEGGAPGRGPGLPPLGPGGPPPGGGGWVQPRDRPGPAPPVAPWS